MGPGTVVAERFVIEGEAGSGGMATVYRARDRQTGETVALKVLRDGSNLERFDREARLLASLDHPFIVRYVAHGSHAGLPYLAMEWLDGEDLARRLLSRRLTGLESVALAKRVSIALSVAHAKGVVHRDLKPSNLFLVNGDIERVKLLDFGVAFDESDVGRVTRSGATLGTPGYMAPEQVRADDAVGPLADLFSLGCVLFECLTHRPAYSGRHAMAILAKILLEPPPDPTEMSPDVPLRLGDFVTRLLAKDAEDRPASAREVAETLERFEAEMSERTLTMRPPPRSSKSSSQLSGADLELVCVIALGPSRDQPSEPITTLGHVAAAYGSHMEVLANGAAVITLRGAVATDLAARAALCALALRDATPALAAGIATGRAELGSRLPVGESIDRAVQLMRRSAADGGVHLDEVTDALLDARFARRHSGGRAVLDAFRDIDTPRTLLGKRTPFVGRDAESASLQGLVTQAFSDVEARVAVVSGPAGAGKSRLRREIVDWAHNRWPEAEVWVARGDSVGAHAPYGTLGRLLRDAALVRDGERLSARQTKLRERIEKVVADPDTRGRLMEFLCEIAGAPLAHRASVRLDAARRDPTVMKDQARRAWVDLVEATTAKQPLLVVLEDMQWGDRPSFDCIDTALRSNVERRLAVMGFSRPDSDLADIWKERGVLRLGLPPLPRRAAERLVTSMLGPDTDGITISTLVEQAGGNAFFLEELIRAAAEGHSHTLPDTVVAMAEARLATLPADARRVLRAASVFGRMFWDTAVRALVGPSEDVERALATLMDRELISHAARSTFPRAVEYHFRHSLVREAAYETMTEEDRALGHALAGDWLENSGHDASIVLADHFERAGLPARALPHIVRAATAALDANDFDAAIAHAERGYGCGVTGDALGQLLRIHAEAHKWRGDTNAAEERGLLAIQRLSTGSDAWFAAAGEVLVATLRLGRTDRLTEIVSLIRRAVSMHEDAGPCLSEDTRPRPPSVAAFVAAARAVSGLLHAGQTTLADELLATLRAVPMPEDPGARARLAQSEGTRALVQGDVAEYLDRMAIAAVGYDEIGDLRMACNARVGLGYALGEVGELEASRDALTAALADAERLGSPQLVESARCNLGFALARLGSLEAAEAMLERAARALAAQGDRRTESAARAYLAWCLAAAKDFDHADIEATRAVHAAPNEPARVRALAMMAKVLLDGGKAEAAMKPAAEAAARLVELGGIDAGESDVRLTHAECLEAVGRQEEALAAARTAAAKIKTRAACITDPVRRESFLSRVESNRKTLELEQRLAIRPGER